MIKKISKLVIASMLFLFSSFLLVGESDLVGNDYWKWIEAEDYPVTNFIGKKGMSWEVQRGYYLFSASNREAIHLKPGMHESHLGFWYAKYWVRAPKTGSYKFYISIASGYEGWKNEISWGINGTFSKPELVATGPEYSKGFRWYKLGVKNLEESQEPYSFEIRFEQGVGELFIDAFFMTNTNNVPNGTQKPVIDRAYLSEHQKFILYPVPVSREIDLYWSVPRKEEIKDNMIMDFAFRGGKKVFPFAIYSFENLSNVIVEVTELNGHHYDISRENLELRIVRATEKRIGNNYPADQTEIVGDLVDYYTTPINMSAYICQQFLIFLNVPEDTEPGIYGGTITVKAGDVEKTLGISLGVLPIYLNKFPDVKQGIYYKLNKKKVEQLGGEPGNLAEYWKQDFLGMAENGITGVSTGFEFILGNAGNITSASIAEFRVFLSIMQEAGFTLPMSLTARALEQGIYGALFNILKDEALAKDKYKQAIAQIIDLGWEYGIEIIFKVADEPYYKPERFVNFFKLAPLVKEVGGSVYLTVPADADLMFSNSKYSVYDLVDYFSFYGPSVDFGYITGEVPYGSLDYLKSQKNIWNYYNINVPGGKLFFSRVTNGVWSWISPFSASCPYIFYKISGTSIFNDKDGSSSDWVYIYRDLKNPDLKIYSMKYVGLLLGYNDLCYLYTLKVAIQEAKLNNIDAVKIQAAENKLAEFKNLLISIGGTANAMVQYFGDKYLNSWMCDIAQQIMNLSDK